MSVPGVSAAASKGNSNGKQTICHATNSNTNPYVVITPNKNGDLDGHAKQHTGPIWNPTLKDQHISWGDIIPPFDYNDHGTPAHFNGLNWTATGQAWFANGCKAPSGGGGGGSTGETTGASTTGETTTGQTTTGETTTGQTTGTTTAGETTGTTAGTTTAGTTGAGGGATTGFTGGGSGSFTSSGGGTFPPPTFTGGGGGPTTLPRTGVSFNDQLGYGGALVLAGAGILLLLPRRRSATA
jgi:LPXTG-motif cell wall-anchored protein